MEATLIEAKEASSWNSPTKLDSGVPGTDRCRRRPCGGEAGSTVLPFLVFVGVGGRMQGNTCSRPLADRALSGGCRVLSGGCPFWLPPAEAVCAGRRLAALSEGFTCAMFGAAFSSWPSPGPSPKS